PQQKRVTVPLFPIAARCGARERESRVLSSPAVVQTVADRLASARPRISRCAMVRGRSCETGFARFLCRGMKRPTQVARRRRGVGGWHMVRQRGRGLHLMMQLHAVALAAQPMGNTTAGSPVSCGAFAVARRRSSPSSWQAVQSSSAQPRACRATGAAMTDKPGARARMAAPSWDEGSTGCRLCCSRALARPSSARQHRRPAPTHQERAAHPHQPAGSAWSPNSDRAVDYKMGSVLPKDRRIENRKRRQGEKALRMCPPRARTAPVPPRAIINTNRSEADTASAPHRICRGSTPGDIGTGRRP
ncbi:MAG: hypothetical protein ACLFTP_05945, partial [Rhodosalinus sp.]